MQRKSSFPVEKFQEYLTPYFKDIRTGKKNLNKKVREISPSAFSSSAASKVSMESLRS